VVCRGGEGRRVAPGGGGGGGCGGGGGEGGGGGRGGVRTVARLQGGGNPNCPARGLWLFPQVRGLKGGGRKGRREGGSDGYVRRDVFREEMR